MAIQYDWYKLFILTLIAFTPKAILLNSSSSV